MGDAQQDRRKHPRVRVAGKTKGRVTAIYDAILLDISLGGALVEHSEPVRPGTLSSLDLDLQGMRVRLRCRVVRSRVSRPEMQPDGERALIYHTGLEFIDPSDETRQALNDFIQSMI